MTETTYESIEALIQDVEVNGSQVRCTFLHADGETIDSSATIPRDNSVMGKVGNTVKRQLVNRARSTASRSIFQLLGGGMLGRTGSIIVRATVPSRVSNQNEPDENDIHEAVVKAFDKVSSKYMYDEQSGTWAPSLPDRQKISILPKEEKQSRQNTSPEKSNETGLNRLEKEVLARLLVEICDADGKLTSEEEDLLKSIIPKELGNADKIRQMDFISPMEIKSLSMNAKQQILKCAFLMSYADFQPHENEMSIIHEYGQQMGMNIAQLKQIEKEAKLETLSTCIDENTSRSEVFEIASQINIPNDEAEMVLINLKSNIR